MQTAPLIAVGATAAVFLTLLVLLAWGFARLRAAEARAVHATLRLDSQGRSLGLLVRELEAPGLGLLGLASRVPPEVASRIESEGRRLLALADEVADHLAAGPGPFSLREARLPLGPLLREAVEGVALPLGEGARHWHVAPEATSLLLIADHRAIRRILAQALARAARETRAGDHIAIRLVRAAETVALVIEDEGAGLRRDDLAQGDGTRGLSLGLSAARALMRAHGGELTMESMPGIGARTWLTFPRHRVMDDQLAA